jgi:TRAP-type C4-dicarboxylate transport system substrate-binding protein
MFRKWIAAAAIVALPGVPAMAADYTFRLADALPPQHVITRAIGQSFMDRVTELTEGAVDSSTFPPASSARGRRC